MKTSHTPLLLGMVLTTLLSSPAWAAEKVGVVGAAGATLTAVSEGKSRTLKTGDDVFLGDTLATNGSGKAQIIFLDRSSITLKPNSDLTVDTFVYDPQSSSGDLALKSAKGAFRFIGGALSKKKPVKLETPVGTIGIRGGIADATIDANGETDAFFLYGEELTFVNGEGQTSSTTQFGSGFTLASAGDTPQPLAKQEVQSHLDGFRPAPTDAPLPGAPNSDSINQQMNLGSDEATPLASDEGPAPVASQASNDSTQPTETSSPQGDDPGGQPLAESRSASNSTGGAPLPWLADTPVQNVSNLTNVAVQTRYDDAIAQEAADGRIFRNTLSTNASTLPPDELKGFAAGFGGDSIYANGESDSVRVTQDVSGRIINSSVTLNRVAGTGSSAISGALVNAGAGNPQLAGLCSSCNFMRWGEWNGSATNAGGQTLNVSAIPFVVGEVTSTANIASTGTANYNGASYANFTQSGITESSVGNMLATIDMGNRKLDSIQITHNNVFGQSIVIQGGAAAGHDGRPIDPNGTGRAVFQVPAASSEVIINGSSIGSATINGALFGPNAQNIGGNFYMDGSTLDGAGIFVGSR